VDGKTSLNFEYNYLNLPTRVSNSTGGTVVNYIYDATGKRLAKTSSAGTVNYLDGIQYKVNNTIDFIQTEEGIARSNEGSYSYEYNLSDHLGNARFTFHKSPVGNELVPLQEDNYYASGLRKSVNEGNNKYLYNGKELQEELGQYDYGSRFYDPVIGRWNVVDPLAEMFDPLSPYNYGMNNPILMIDPDGNAPEDFSNGNIYSNNCPLLPGLGIYLFFLKFIDSQPFQTTSPNSQLFLIFVLKLGESLRMFTGSNLVKCKPQYK